MFVNVKIRLLLEIAESVNINVKDYVEVSIDCYECKALKRSIIISKNLNNMDYESFQYMPKINFNNLEKLIEDKNREIAFCTPRCHVFPAYLKNITISRKTRNIEVSYVFKYSYTEFSDNKHNKQSQIVPSWARITFELTCPNCSCVSKDAIQNNMVTPFTSSCDCGFVFYTQHNEFPVIEVF